MRRPTGLLALGAAGLLVGRYAGPLYQRWQTAKPVQIADNSRYFAGHDARPLLFGTGTCPYCARTRDLFARLGVSFREQRIDTSSEARELYATLEAPGVPVILIGNRRIFGFREDQLRDALADARLLPVASPIRTSDPP